MNYQLTRIQETDIFFLAKEGVKLLGENLITGTFQQVLGLASTLKNDANDIGTGDLVQVQSAIELTNVIDARWFLLVKSDRYQITRTSGTEIYSLPTDYIEALQGSLENIFNKIIQLETT